MPMTDRHVLPRGFAAVVLAMLWLASPTAQAVDRGDIAPVGNSIEGYEPSTLGLTHDSDDVRFIDFSLSIKYRLFPKTLSLPRERLYLAFTGRFGMYANTRESSPVIAKSYNPKLIWRHVLDDDPYKFNPYSIGDREARKQYASYIDLAYAHESNGQSTNSADELALERSTAERPEFANDTLSRGWDYAQLVWKTTLLDRPTRRITGYTDFKYFLPRGLLQNGVEEYNTWENDPEGKPRNTVNGLAATVEYEHLWRLAGKRDVPWLANPMLAVRYETGYRSAFKYNTVRLEAGMRVIELPLTIWVQHGYNSDLAQYYKQVTSYGLQLRMGGF